MIRRTLLLVALGVGCIGSASFAASMPIQANRNLKLEEHVAWVIDSLKLMQTVKAGMTRGDLLRLFEPDGGLQSGKVFGFRDCRYFKVDVEWQRAERVKTGMTLAEQLAAIEGQPGDVIKAISRPYIEFMKID